MFFVFHGLQPYWWKSVIFGEKLGPAGREWEWRLGDIDRERYPSRDPRDFDRMFGVYFRANVTIPIVTIVRMNRKHHSAFSTFFTRHVCKRAPAA